MKRDLLGQGEVKAAVEYIRSKTQNQPTIGIVLGSGLGAFGERPTSKDIFSYDEIPGFSVPTVPGHFGRLIIGHLKGKIVAILQGRCHLYEGYAAAQVTFPIRVLAELGVRVLIVTSAAGAVSRKLSPGNVMLIRDHLNLMGDNPLKGQVEGGRSFFLDMTTAYDVVMIKGASQIAGEVGLGCQVGVLAAVPGPSYETHAEAAMLKTFGADAVCMSTVPEVIMARYLNMQVLGMVLITNMLAGESRFSAQGRKGSENLETSGHEKVLKVAMEGISRVSMLLERVVEVV